MAIKNLYKPLMIKNGKNKLKKHMNKKKLGLLIIAAIMMQARSRSEERRVERV